MKNYNVVEEVRGVLQRFQAGYTERDLSTLDDFLTLFVQDGDPELIGIGASERGGWEWFEGVDSIRDIIQSDWEYWGDVVIDVAGAKITVRGEVAWFTTTGTLEQTDAFDSAMPFYLEQMKKFIEDGSRDAQGAPMDALIEATHYGLRRIRERLKGVGHQWPFVLSAVLQREGGQWRFHTIHWSMPVD